MSYLWKMIRSEISTQVYYQPLWFLIVSLTLAKDLASIYLRAEKRTIIKIHLLGSQVGSRLSSPLSI